METNETLNSYFMILFLNFNQIESFWEIFSCLYSKYKEQLCSIINFLKEANDAYVILIYT